jgi:hypothetical protein
LRNEQAVERVGVMGRQLLGMLGVLAVDRKELNRWARTDWTIRWAKPSFPSARLMPISQTEAALTKISLEG